MTETSGPALPLDLATRAAEHPDAPAVIMAGGDVVSYRELDEQSNRLAAFLRHKGLRTGDHIAILMENCATFLEVAWAAQRSGLYYTALNSHLRGAEVQYILDDCGATALVTAPAMARSRHQARPVRCPCAALGGGTASGIQLTTRPRWRVLAPPHPRRVRRARDALLVGDDRVAPRGYARSSPPPPWATPSAAPVQIALALAATGGRTGVACTCRRRRSTTRRRSSTACRCSGSGPPWW